MLQHLQADNSQYTAVWKDLCHKASSAIAIHILKLLTPLHNIKPLAHQRVNLNVMETMN